MKTEFYKYQGTGNDFIIIDNRTSRLILEENVVKSLCDRRFGIGADGLILLHNMSDYDFEMVYFNSDGRESTMCGNGGRCIAAFAHRLGLIKDKTSFWAIDQEHNAEIISVNENTIIVKLSLHDITEIHHRENDYVIDTGSPHYIRFTDDADRVDLVAEARKIRYNHEFKHEGINVNFVQINDDHIFVRTYERGVEDETLSCGTGVVASALAYAVRSNTDNTKVNVRTRGGELNVSFKKIHHSFNDVWLEGPATFVFKGEIEL